MTVLGGVALVALGAFIAFRLGIGSVDETTPTRISLMTSTFMPTVPLGTVRPMPPLITAGNVARLTDLFHIAERAAGCGFQF